MQVLLPGITADRVSTSRLTACVLSLAGRTTGQPVLFVHGNVSSSLFWQTTMLALPDGYRPLAMDLRGFGETDPEPADATRGLGDYADDLAALIETLGLAPVHLVGWSMGGGVVLQYLSERRRGYRAASVTLVAPLSPFGFGGTRGTEGTLSDPSGAGSGGGAANADFVSRLAAGDRGLVPGWPGADTRPPQPMLAQTRAVLDDYGMTGGRYREVVIRDSGHGPHLDQPEQFRAALAEHLAEHPAPA
jgi:pimeloyl-ACP methyl ester carboxylesterase